MFWKTSGRRKVYPVCERNRIGPGVLFSDDLRTPVTEINQGLYNQYCFKGATPMLNTDPGLNIGNLVESLPIARESWISLTENENMGHFAYSVVSVIYSLSVSAVLTWSLTLFVLTNFTIKPSLLLKVSTTLSSAYLLVVIIKAIVSLHGQQLKGYIHGSTLLDHINHSPYINAIDLVVVILLQINQVQVIMRIFSRQKEKRITFFVGVIASISSQVIWAVTRFHQDDETNETADILAAFIYLVRIAMSFCYAALISGFMISKANYLISNRSIWLISLLTTVLLYSPVAFFIADISNSWVSELSEVFSVINYVICVVLPWEWCNKFNVIMKLNEKEGVLGRRFHEDELYELDRYELFVEEADDKSETSISDDNNVDDNDNNDTNDDNETSTAGMTNSQSSYSNRKLENSSNSTSPIMDGESLRSYDTNILMTNLKNRIPNMKHLLKDSTSGFLKVTDKFIATVFSIPRSFSSSPPVEYDNQLDDLEIDAIGVSTSYHQNLGTATSNQNDTNVNTNSQTTSNVTRSNDATNRRDVFVYPTRQAILDTSDNDD